MKTITGILVVGLGTGASMASTVPLEVDAPALAGGISVGVYEAAAGGGAVGGVVISAMGEVGGLLATGNVALAGGSGGGVIEADAPGGGGYVPVDPGLLGGQDLGAEAPLPLMNTPMLPESPKGDGGGGGNTIVAPLPGAGVMGMAGLLCVAGATRRRRM